jgi:glycosyltransferase involved in cell wall biosynthesis
MNPLISVLIPVYNVENYIKKALFSIIEQSYKNIEIIIVDDASTDGTFEILSSISEVDKRIRLFRNEVNKKICKTLNFAYSKASGEYILRMDGDDICSADRIARKLDFLLSNNLDIVGCSTITIDINDNEIGRTYSLDSTKLIFKSAEFRSPMQHIWLAKKEVYDTLNGYRELPGAEDYDFILRALSYGFRVSNIREYFGYSVRIGRLGNTISTIGLRQRKLHEYVWSLFVEREKYGVDSYSPENLERSLITYDFFDKLFRRSTIYLNKAISEERFFFKSIYIILSMQSPHQIKYLLNAVRYRLAVKTEGCE